MKKCTYASTGRFSSLITKCCPVWRRDELSNFTRLPSTSRQNPVSFDRIVPFEGSSYQSWLSLPCLSHGITDAPGCTLEPWISSARPCILLTITKYPWHRRQDTPIALWKTLKRWSEWPTFSLFCFNHHVNSQKFLWFFHANCNVNRLSTGYVSPSRAMILTFKTTSTPS